MPVAKVKGVGAERQWREVMSDVSDDRSSYYRSGLPPRRWRLGILPLALTTQHGARRSDRPSHDLGAGRPRHVVRLWP